MRQQMQNVAPGSLLASWISTRIKIGQRRPLIIQRYAPINVPHQDKTTGCEVSAG